MAFLSNLFVLAVAVIGGSGMLIGAIFRWWGLLAPVAFACFLAYAWEFTEEGIYFALIAGLLGCAAVTVGALIRRRFR
jgi:hypothetical protein